MPVQDFITQAEIEDAPEDARMAFADLVAHAERRLVEMTSALSDEEHEWHEKQEIRHSFMNVIIGLARKFQIEPIASMAVPRMKDFAYPEFHGFRTELDFYMTQMMIDNTIRNRRYSVTIALRDKEKIRDYIRALRDAIDESQLSNAKKSALHKRLSDFEVALEKSRLNLMEATLLAMAVLGFPGAVWQSADIVKKLTQNILQTVAEAKAVDDEERRLPPTEEPAALLPPRGDFGRDKRKGADYAAELDDEIPF